MKKSSYTKIFTRSLTAIAISSVIGMSTASAEDIRGVISITKGVAEGITVKAVNVDTGTSRTIELDADGSYRLAKLPTGNYEVTVSKGNQVLALEKVRLSLGANTITNFEIEAPNDDTEVIEVVASSVATLDLTSSDSGLVIGEAEIDRLPVSRTLTSVALLAPGVIGGDQAFGANTASFGGSSVAENICYINGMEVTNTRNGLGCGELPFEFYKEFQVKTGGYSARYGRATGGAINATAKKGTNEWEFAVTGTYTPDAWRSDNEQIARANGGTGTIYRDDTLNEQTNKEMTFSVGGPIIEDKLFFYAIINPKDDTRTLTFQPSFWNHYLANSQYIKREASGSDNLFWGATVDWDINDNHRLSYFGYSNRTDSLETIYAYNANLGKEGIGDVTGTQLRSRGGETHSISYTGYITDDLIVTAMAGRIETEYETSASNIECSTVNDGRTNPANPAVSCGPGGSFGENNDTNTQYALDLEYTIGNHTITAGYEKQERDTTRFTIPTGPGGGHSYTYYTVQPGASIQGTDGVLFTNTSDQPQDYVQDRVFSNAEKGGGFTSDIKAYFIEDVWTVSDDLTLTLGLRVDDFTNTGVTGRVISSFTTDVAPRLGFSWDPTGNGESKLFGTFGQYYLPIANNTIYRAASGVDDRTTHYTFTGIDANGEPIGATPVNGTMENSQVVNSIATFPEEKTFVSNNAEPFSKIEYILGYETTLTDEYTMLVKGTYRYVDSALDDYCGAYSNAHCLMINPGKDAIFYVDADDDGLADTDTPVTYDNKTTVRLPKGENKYYALETTLNYRVDDFAWTASYTWSHSYGNFEGAVKSDNGQQDAGITTDFDFPALMDGSYGNLPNDRRHVFKFFGSYNLTENFVVGWNSTLASGRPRSVVGGSYWSDDPDLYGSYGDTYYVTQDDGTITYHPRGSNGTTPWTFKLDLSASYSFEFKGVDMKASLDIFNVLDSSQPTSYVDNYEAFWTAGSRNQFYNAPLAWQTPRYATLNLEARF
ncbi:TonB-dependent receptor [Thalassotalea marina]|uniref:Oar protein n=1 Tax=Thalassotalea marina TaxID=1673741 RepID=A0A919BDJ4_9GAMM|nr:TonB-dependent receptor [Thalassotalea marina]GHF81467.1 Oar protein [Thalassotalea marina]